MNLKFKYFGVLVCACLFVCASLPAKVKKTPVYIFGFSASFTDSVAYITDIQCLDSAYIETKNGFLMDRMVYSDQLQTYLEGIKDMKNATSAVFFDIKKKNVQAEYNKIKKRYEKDDNVILTTMDGEPFRFQSPVYHSSVKTATEQKTAKQRASGKKGKAGKKKMKNTRSNDQTPVSHED